MAHRIESDDTMAYRESGGLTWHGLGTPVGDEMEDRAFFSAAGLDWKVIKLPVLIQGKTEQRPANGWRALVRSTDGKCLGMATDEYQPVQNAEVWEFFRRFCDAGEMKLETAGSLCGGAKVWALAKMPGSFSLPNRPNDKTEMYCLFSTGHRPGFATQAELTAVRVVCHNTLDAARGRYGKGGDGQQFGRFRLSHLAKWNHSHLRKAQGIVQQGRQALEQYQQDAELLSNVHTDRDTNYAYLVNLFQPELVEKVINAAYAPGGKQQFSVTEAIAQPEVQAAAGRRVLENIMLGSSLEAQAQAGARVIGLLVGQAQKGKLDYSPTVQRVQQAITAQPGGNHGTLWDTLNGVTYYVDHVKGREASASLDSALFGQGRATKSAALDLALDYADALRA